jgi:hypothetical protein
MQKNREMEERLNLTALHIWDIICDVTNVLYEKNKNEEEERNKKNNNTMKMDGRPRAGDDEEEKKSKEAIEEYNIVLESLNSASNIKNASEETVGLMARLKAWTGCVVNQHSESPRDILESRAMDRMKAKVKNLNWPWIMFMISAFFGLGLLIYTVAVRIYSSFDQSMIYQDQSQSVIDSVNVTIKEIACAEEAVSGIRDEVIGNVLAAKEALSDGIKNYIMTFSNWALTGKDTLLSQNLQTMKNHIVITYNEIAAGRIRPMPEYVTDFHDNVLRLTSNIINNIGLDTQASYESARRDLDDLKAGLLYSAGMLKALPGYDNWVKMFNMAVEEVMAYRAEISKNLLTQSGVLKKTIESLTTDLNTAIGLQEKMKKIIIETPYYYEILKSMGIDNVLSGEWVTLDYFTFGLVSSSILNGGNILKRIIALSRDLNSVGQMTLGAALIWNSDTNLIDTCFYILAGLAMIDLVKVGYTSISSFVSHYIIGDENTAKFIDWIFGNAEFSSYTDDNDKLYRKYINRARESDRDPFEYLKSKYDEGLLDDMQYARALLVYENENRAVSPAETYVRTLGVRYRGYANYLGYSMVALNTISILCQLSECNAVQTYRNILELANDGNVGGIIKIVATMGATGSVIAQIISWASIPGVSPIFNSIISMTFTPVVNFIMGIMRRISRGTGLPLPVVILFVMTVLSRWALNPISFAIIDVANYVPGNLRDMTFQNDVDAYYNINTQLDTIKGNTLVDYRDSNIAMEHGLVYLESFGAIQATDGNYQQATFDILVNGLAGLRGLKLNVKESLVKK